MVHRSEEQVKAESVARTLAGTCAAVASAFLDIVFPPQCLVCRSLDSPVICDGCRLGFEPIAPPFCSCCGNPGATADCADCRAAGKAGWRFDAARSAFAYSGTLAEAIRRFKYGGCELLGEPLGHALADRLATGDLLAAERLQEIDFVLPIPLHRSRLRRRGFNQCDYLARPVAGRLERPCLSDVLCRVVATDPQASLAVSARRSQMTEATFIVRADRSVREKGILLIDDVRTTGSTLNAAAGALKAAGARTVYALTLAGGI